MSGEFTINPVAVGTISNVALTDASGGLHVSVSDGNGGYTSYVAASSDGVKAATIALQAQITYSGPLTDATAVQAQWLATVASVTLTLTCTEATGTPVNTGGQAPATSDIRFVTDANATTAVSSNPGVVTINADQFNFTSASQTVATTVGTVYVAITGNDSAVWDDTHKPSYTLKLEASHVKVGA